MKYIKLYSNRHDFVFDEQRYFPNTALVNGEDEPTYFTDVAEVVFELTVTLPTEKVVTGETYTLAVEYGGADVFASSTISTTGDVTLNGTQFTANTDGDFSVSATYDDKTVTLNGTSKLMTAAPTIFESSTNNQYGQHYIHISKSGATKRATFNGVEYTSDEDNFSRLYYEELTAQTVVVTATAQETGKWESDTATATFNIPAAQTLTATISDDTLDDGQTAQLTVMYGSTNATSFAQITASGDVTCTSAGVVTAAYSTGSGSIVVSLNNLPTITINVTVAQPQVATNIVFADNDVKSIVANAFGSNGEITTAQAAAVTTWFEGGYNNTSTNPFCKNSYVDSFDEFGTYFTGVSEIGVDAFQDCYNMQSITLPSSLTYIPDYAFSGCSSLGSVTIPAAVTSIGSRVFDGCTLLESMNIPENVSSIGSRVFDNCQCLTYISVDANNSYFNDGNGSNVIIDNNGNLLYGGLACSVIPNTVNSIGDRAFYGRTFNYQTLTIPSSVTSIGYAAFAGRMYQDVRLIMESTTPPTLGTGNDFSESFIYVPSASLDLYKAATNWSYYAARIRAYLTVSLSSENIVTGETYTLYVDYYGDNVLSNATITSTGDVTISGSSFTANSDGAFSITATYNGYTATLNGTAATPTPEPTPEYEYTTAVLDFSQMENTDYFDTWGDNEGNIWNFNGCKIYNGYLRIPNLGSFVGVQLDNLVDTPSDGCISYIKMTHTTDSYKVNDSATYGEGVFTCDVDYDTTTHTTTFSNFVSTDQESPFDGMNFMLLNNATTQIRVTRIEVCYATAEVAPTPEPEYAVVALDCSELADANPLEFCATYDPNEPIPDGLITLDCGFDGEVSYVENGVITIPTNGSLNSFNVDANYESIVYLKLTHPSAEYKLNADTEVGDPLSFTCDVDFDSTTLTTTFSNFVSTDEYAFDGSTFQLYNGGSTDIKITRIEVGYVPAEEEEE